MEGARSCAGQALAVMNLTATLAMLYGSFTFRLADEVRSICARATSVSLGRCLLSGIAKTASADCSQIIRFVLLVTWAVLYQLPVGLGLKVLPRNVIV